MRDYGKVSTDVWMQQGMGMLEKSLLAYLHSSPHTNWIGCFYCPAGYAAEDMEVPVSRVRKAFAVLAEKGFIRINGKMVFLPGFVALNPVENGNTATARFKTFMALPAGEHRAWVAAEMLQHLRHLTDEQRAALEGFVPQTVTGTVPQTVQGIEKEKEKENNTTGTSPVVGRAQAHATPAPDDRPDDRPDELRTDEPEKPPEKPSGKHSARGTRLPESWQLPRDWGDWALQKRQDLNADDVRREAELFANHWHAKAGADARKADWQATWRNWILRTHAKPRASPNGYPPAQTRAQHVHEWGQRFNVMLERNLGATAAPNPRAGPPRTSLPPLPALPVADMEFNHVAH